MAFLYDTLQEDLSPAKWADFLLRLIKKHNKQLISGDREEINICDLGCGTARVSIELIKRGFCVHGVDNSAFMLDRALKNSEAADVNLLLTCQDIRAFSLYTPADIVICLLDTVNHLPTSKDVARLFKRVWKNTASDGLWIFDIVPPAYLENTLGNQIFYAVEDDYSLLWENQFIPGHGKSISDLTLFLRESTDLFRKEELRIVEKAYSPELIRKLLEDTGWKCLAMHGDLKMRAPQNLIERVFFVAQKI